ncbi:MAG: Uma2 family endonuclease [Gemmataceae bacterium]
MSVLTAPPPAAPSAPLPTRPRPSTYGFDPSAYRFTVRQYEQMTRAGVLTKDDRGELLEGYPVLKIGHDPGHDGTLDLVKSVLPTVLPADWFLRIQQTVSLADSNPEPDVAIVRGTSRTFLARHPGPADDALIVEVPNSSLDRDMDDKAVIYAAGGIAAYWVIDVVNGVVECFARPAGSTYADRRTALRPDTLTFDLDGTPGTLPAADVLP